MNPLAVTLLCYRVEKGYIRLDNISVDPCKVVKEMHELAITLNLTIVKMNPVYNCFNVIVRFFDQLFFLYRPI